MTPTLLALACALMPPPAPDTSFLRQYAQTRGYMLGRPAKRIRYKRIDIGEIAGQNVIRFDFD